MFNLDFIKAVANNGVKGTMKVMQGMSDHDQVTLGFAAGLSGSALLLAALSPNAKRDFFNGVLMGCVSIYMDKSGVTDRFIYGSLVNQVFTPKDTDDLDSNLSEADVEELKKLEDAIRIKRELDELIEKVEKEAI